MPHIASNATRPVCHMPRYLHAPTRLTLCVTRYTSNTSLIVGVSHLHVWVCHCDTYLSARVGVRGVWHVWV